MANVQAQFGFKHIGYLSGGAPDFQQSQYAIQKTYTTNIGFGDPVTRLSASSPYIIQATGALASTQPIAGIFVGCQYTPTGGLGIPQWSPGWTGPSVTADAIAYVIDAPNAQFLVATLQTAITSGQIGQVVTFTTGAPSTTGGMYSVAVVDANTATSAGTTTSFLPFRILGLYGPGGQGVPGAYGAVGNGTDPTTNYNWVVVGFNFQLNRSVVGW